MSDLRGIRALQPVVERWLEAWRVLDIEKTLDLYDFDADFCYQPPDLEHPLTNREAVKEYAEQAKKKIRTVQEFACTDMTYDMCGDMMWAYASCYFKALYEGVPEPIAGPVRITFLAQRRSNDWRLVCVHQSSQQRQGQEASGRERVARRDGDLQAKRIAKQLAETFTTGWTDTDLEKIFSPWDREHNKLVYMAFEGPQALRTWPEVEEYAERLRENLSKTGIRFRWPELTVADISAGISGDFLWAHCQRAFTVYHPQNPEVKLGGHPYRETWFAHRKNGAWKAFHYHESVSAPLPLAEPFFAEWWPD